MPELDNREAPEPDSNLGASALQCPSPKHKHHAPDPVNAGNPRESENNLKNVSTNVH